MLGGYANLACEYSTKRYRSNLINWGILPLMTQENPRLQVGDFVLIENVQDVIAHAGEPVALHILRTSSEVICMATLGQMTEEEKQILTSGCLINYYKNA